MTKVIGITGLQNCGKSTLIDRLSTMDNVLVYKETARKLFPILEEFGMDEFQRCIAVLESERIDRIQREVSRGLYKIIVTDRIYHDKDFFASFNDVDTQSYESRDNVDVYDEVILFEKPIADSKNMSEYNGKEGEYNQYIRENVKCPIHTYENFLEDEDRVMEHIQGLMT